MRGTPEQITAEITLVDALLAPEGQRRAFVRRRVLVGRDDLPPATGRRSLAAARAEHVLRVLRRLPLALVRPRARLRDPVSGRGSAGRGAGAGREPAAR